MKLDLIINMHIYIFIGIDNTYGAANGHIGLTSDLILDPSVSVSYIIHNSSDDNIYDYALLLGY